MSTESIETLIAAVIGIILLSLLATIFKFARMYVSDLRFYRACGWDYARESGNVLRCGRRKNSPKMSGRVKLWFGYPVVIAALATLSAVIAAMVLVSLPA